MNEDFNSLLKLACHVKSHDLKAKRKVFENKPEFIKNGLQQAEKVLEGLEGKKLIELTYEERKSQYEKFIAEGHASFKECKYVEALVAYNKGLCCWSWIECSKSWRDCEQEDEDLTYQHFTPASLDEKNELKDLVIKIVNNIALVYIKKKQFNEAIYALNHLIYSLTQVNAKSQYLKYLALQDDPTQGTEMLKIAEKQLTKSMDQENDPDKLKVLRDKLFKLRNEMNRSNKKKKMMKGFLDKRDNLLNDEIEVVNDSLNSNLDTKIDQLNDRVNADIMSKAPIADSYAETPQEYFENESVKAPNDEAVVETVRSEASEDDSIQKSSLDTQKSTAKLRPQTAEALNTTQTESIFTKTSEITESEQDISTASITTKEEGEVPLIKQMKEAKYKLQKEINEAKRIYQSIKISASPDKKKMMLLLDMINDWQAKIDRLTKMMKDRKHNLKHAIESPEPELKNKVMADQGLDMDDPDVKELLTDMQVKNIEKDGLINKQKEKEAKKVSFGKAHVHEQQDEVYDKVYKHGFKDQISNSGVIKLFVVMFILYISIQIGFQNRNNISSGNSFHI